MGYTSSRLFAPSALYQLEISDCDQRHYDVDINPVVTVANQQKPKAMLRAVWEQLSLEQHGKWADAFAACAFDGRKNCFTPVAFPMPKGEWIADWPLGRD